MPAIIFKEKSNKSSLNIIILLIYGLLAVFCLFLCIYTQAQPLNSKKPIHKLNKSSKRFTYNAIRLMLGTSYSIVLLVTALMGVYRSSYLCLQYKYLQSLGLGKQEKSLVFLARTFPELFIYLFIVHKLEILFRSYWVFLFSNIAGLIHMISYIIMPKINIGHGYKMALLLDLEVFKSIFSSFLAYSSSRIIKKTIPDDFLILAYKAFTVYLS